MTVGLADDFRTEDESVELRKALIATQRQLAKQKQRTDELVVATHDAAKQAMLALGPITKVPAPTLAKNVIVKPLAESGVINTTQDGVIMETQPQF